MSTHIKSDIDAYLGGHLPESRRREVDLHTRDCEPCRKALYKARTRRAHSHREALKRASAQSAPNLLMNRLQKQGGEPIQNTGGWKGWIVIAVVAAAGAYGWHYFRPKIETVPQAVSSAPAKLPARAVSEPASAPTEAQVDGRDVALSTPTAPRRRRTTAPVVSSPTVPALPSVPGASQIPEVLAPEPTAP